MLGTTNHEAFVTQMSRCEDDLLRFILPLVGCFDDAQEVLQNTAIALWRKFEDFDPERPFLPWAKQFARLELLKHHKRSQQYLFLTPALLDSLMERQSDMEDSADQRREALFSCIEGLPEKSRDLLDQRYRTKKTIRAVAAETGRSEDALYQALTRMRRALLDCVERKLAAGEV